MKDEFGGVLVEKETPSHDEFGGVFVKAQPKQEPPPPPIQAPRPVPLPRQIASLSNPPPIPPAQFAPLPVQEVTAGGEKFYFDPIKAPKRGFLPAFGRGAKHTYTVAGVPLDTAMESKDMRKRELARAFAEAQAAHKDPTFREQAGEMAGGLFSTITQLAPAMVAKSKPMASAIFGAQTGGSAWYKAGMNALAEGKNIDDALTIADAAMPVGAAAGAASIYGFPGKAAPTILGKAAQTGQVAGIGAGLAGSGNVAERAAGLETPITEGMAQNALFMSLLHGTGVSLPPAFRYAKKLADRAKQALESPRAGELPPIPRPIQPPPLPEGGQRAVPVRETAKVPVVETPRAGKKVGERILTPEELAAKEKAPVKEAETLTPEQQAVERQRLQAELEGKLVEPAKPEVSEVQQQAAIRDRIKSENPGLNPAILERMVKKEMAKVRGETVAAPEVTPEATKNIESIKDITSSPEKFAKSKLGTTEAWELGDKFKSKGDIAALKQHVDALRAEATAKAADPNLSFGDRAAWSKIKSTANEILQGATKPKESNLVQQHFAKKKLRDAGKQVIKIETPEGVVEAEFAGWQEGLPGKPAVPNVGYIKASGDISHGPLLSGHKILDKIPTFEEWSASKGKGPTAQPKEVKTDERKFFEDLNAAKERLRKENPAASEEYLNTMAMEEVRPAVKKAPPVDALKDAEQLAKDENLQFKTTGEMPGAEWEFRYKGEGKAKDANFSMPEGSTKAEIQARLAEVKNSFEKPTQPSELPKTPEAPVTAESIGEPPKPPQQPPPLPSQGAPESLPAAIVKEPASDAVFRMREAIPAAFRYFSEGMVERVARSGGEHSKQAAPMLNRVVSNQKGHYGDLTPVLDPALEAAGKMNKATKWANDFTKVTDGAAVARAPEAIEGKIEVPDFAKPTIELAKKANLRTGQMYEPVTEGHKATGAAQRNLTAFGFDLIRRGKGNVLERLAEGTAKINNKPIEAVKAMLRKMKETYDEPSPNVASIERVNQDFQREFPRAITHVKVNTYLGAKWEPVLHSQLYSYLEASARRASHVRSFREAFRTPEDIDTMSRNVRSELDPSHQKDFDALIRGLQGHPSDNYGGMTILSPDQPPAATLKLFNQTAGNLMAKFVLSGQMMTQAGETIAGATPIFFGAPRTLKAMAKVRQLYTEMERTGSVNKVIYDMSTDPTRPILGKFRQAGNIISKGTAQQFLNELQEGLAAAAARFVREDIMAGRLSKWDKAMLPLTFEKMGFTKAQAADMIQGKQPHLLAEFERKAAAWMTSGNKAIAEGSRLGASRLFNSIFRFQSYAMARSNQLRKVWGGVSKAAQDVAANPNKENAARLWNESRQFARFHTGATIQGALTSAVFALFYGGPSGLKILYNEAKDEPEKFLMESFMAATSGPLYLVMRGKEYGGLSGIGEQFIRSMFPYQIMRNFIDMAQGAGSYRDTLPKDRVGKFVQQKIPASRAISTGLSMVGLGWENKPLENSIKGFYRWRRDEMGSSTFKDETEAYKKRAYFRTHMRKAVNALKTGDIEGVKASIAKAAQSPDLKPSSIVSSLNARKILKNPNLRDLQPDELEKLRQRIGPEAVERLQQFDAMIDALIEIYQ